MRSACFVLLAKLAELNLRGSFNRIQSTFYTNVHYNLVHAGDEIIQW